MRLTPTSLMLSAALGLAACAAPAAPVSVNPYPPVPPPRAEVMPKPPVSEEPLVWQAGHYDWTNVNYIWRPGRWVPRAGHGNLWLQEHWALENGQWIWVPAHWVS